MAIDLAIPTRARAALTGHTVVISHLTERFGTFFIIVLGESVMAIVAEASGFELTIESWLVGGLGFMIALRPWWIYFDLADTPVVDRGTLGLVYVYSHFPCWPASPRSAKAQSSAITEANQPGLTAGTRWALGGGIGAFALSLAALHIGAEWTTTRDRTFLGRIILAALALTLAAAGGQLPPAWFVTVLTVAVLAQLLLEAFTARAGAATIVDPAVTDTRPDRPAEGTRTRHKRDVVDGK